MIEEVGVRGQGGSDHQLQQLLLRALVQVGPLERHQLAGGGVAGHAYQAQVVEAPPCNQKEERGARSGESLDTAAWGWGGLGDAEVIAHPARRGADSGLARPTAL